jgi:pyruvate,water dikinase
MDARRGELVDISIVLDLGEVSRGDLAVAGGKGANLGEMIRAGFPVPPGFVVTAQAFADQAAEWGLAERIGALVAANDWAAASAAAEEVVQSGAMLPAIESAIREALADLGAEKVAVRSSATAEDLADASFAGQQETYLDVAGESEVLAAIRRCWASLYHPKAFHYRHARGISHLDVAIAVVVQEMVRSDAAGVLFTVDPVAQRSDRMLLSATFGLGEAVVSGRQRGDTYRVRREPSEGAAASERPSTRTAHAALAIVDRDLETPGRPSLSDASVLDLCHFGLSLEAHFGGPQDVEFAVAGGRISLLQSRPITTLGAAEIEPIEPLGELDFLQQRSIPANLDRFPIAPKPLDHWLMNRANGAITHMIRYIGFDIEEGGEQPLWREAFVPPRSRPTLRLLGVPARVARGLGQDWSAWWESEPAPRLRELCRPIDLTALDDAELLRHADRMVRTFGETLGVRFEPMLGLMGNVGLGIGARMAVGKERAPAVVADLFAGLPTKTSETNQAVFRLSRQALSAGPEVQNAILEGRIDDLQASEAGRAFLAAFQAFLEEYGHREGTCLYLSAPVWRHDPETVWALVRGFLNVSELREDSGDERHRAALEEVERGLGRVPGLSGAFRSLLERVRAIVAYRENTHFDLSRPLAAMQSIVHEIGRRLHEREHLPSPADVFYLTEAEVKAWLPGGAPARGEIESLLRRRRATYQVVNGRWQKRRFSGDGASGELRGTGASAGVVKARARIVRGEHQFDRLKPGEILVCTYTNPSWTPLFSYAAGVVTDTGGPGSHAAIVAREYGIPAVMGAAGATERIADGQEILVDGAEGRVTLVGRADGR